MTTADFRLLRFSLVKLSL